MLSTAAASSISNADDLKYYKEITAPAPGSLISEFSEMDLDSLVGLAEALKDNPERDIEHARSFAYANYYIFTRTKSISNLRTAIKALQEELDGTSAGYEDTLLRDLTVMCYKLAGCTGSPDDLEAAIYRAQALLSASDYLHPDWFARWDGLVGMLRVFAAITGNDIPLDEMLQGAAGAIQNAGHIIDLYQRGGDGTQRDVKDDLRQLKSAIPFALSKPGSDFGEILFRMSAVLAIGLWSQSQDPDDMKEAIIIAEMAIPRPFDGTGLRPDEGTAGLFNSVAEMFTQRFNSGSGDVEDLDRAVRYLEQAVLWSVHGDHMRRARLANLHITLVIRYAAGGGRVADLDRAIRIMERVLSELDPADAFLPEFQHLLATNLKRRFKVSETSATADLELLDRSIAIYSDVVSAARRDGFRRSNAHVWLRELSDGLALRCMYKHSFEDLEMSCRVAEEAVKVCKDQNVPRSEYLDSLSYLVSALHHRHERFRDPEDLAKLILRAEEGLSEVNVHELDKGNPQNKYGMLNWLHQGLLAQYRATGDEAVFHESVRRAEQALQACPENAVGRDAIVGNLADIYRERYKQFGDVGDLDKAIELLRREIENIPPGGERKVQPLLHRLGLAYESRFTLDPVGFREDIDMAISYGQKAIDLTPRGHHTVEQARTYDTLAQLWYAKWRVTDSSDDLEKGLSAQRKSINAALESSDVNLACYKFNLALALDFKEDQDPKDLTEVAVHCTEAIDLEKTDTALRIKCAITAASAFRKLYRLKDAAEATERAVLLLSSLGSRAIKQRDQQQRLKISSNNLGIARIAVADGFNAGKDMRRCLELLEFGRGIINGLKFDSRTDLSQLELKHPQLAKRFIDLRDKLDMPATSADERGLAARPELHQKHNLVKEFDDIVDAIRSQAGFDGFMQPPRAADLALASTSLNEAVVVINIGMRCDAILIQDGKIQHLELPNLLLKDIDDNVWQMRMIRRATMGSHGSRGRKLTSILGWLWKSVVEPVLDSLGYTAQPDDGEKWPRVWWVPTGALTQMPLHAAGYHSSKRPGQSALDRVVSSYSPSVKALMYSRRQTAVAAASATAPPGKIILASMSETPGESNLAYADREIDELEQILHPSQHERVEKLRQPSKAELVASLASRCSVFHFAGHGMSNSQDPSDSCLLLRDWQTAPFTVKDLIGLRLYQHPPWMAYLSACSTGESQDEKLYDESIHLVSACQEVGFQHVVGSLWEVSDWFSLATAKEVYQFLSDSGGLGTTGNVAVALHLAVRRLRDLTGPRGSKRSGEGEEEEDILWLSGEEDEEEWCQHSQEDDIDGTGDDGARGLRGVKSVTPMSTAMGDPLIWAAYIHVGM